MSTSAILLAEQAQVVIKRTLIPCRVLGFRGPGRGGFYCKDLCGV